MVTSLNNQRSARDIGYQMSQYIAARITASGAVTVSTKVGTIPAGAVITQVNTRIVTPFAGGTPLLTLGQLGDSGLDNLVAAINELTAGGEVLQPLSNITQPLTADTEFWAQVTGTATAGDAYVAISYIKPLN